MSDLTSSLVGLIEQVLINLESSPANAFYSLASPVVFAGDFEEEIYVVANDATASNTYNGLAGTATDYFKSTSTTSFTIANATSGAKVMASPTALQSGKYTRVRVRRVGSDVSVAVSDGGYGAAISGFTGDVSIDVLGQSNNANYFDGTLALPVFTNVATPADSESYELNKLTGNYELPVGNVTGSELITGSLVLDDDLSTSYNGSDTWNFDYTGGFAALWKVSSFFPENGAYILEVNKTTTRGSVTVIIAGNGNNISIPDGFSEHAINPAEGADLRLQFGSADFAGSIALSVKQVTNAATYNNIAETQDVRDTYTLSADGTEWVGALRTIEVA
jgi:hypothetical protein